MEVTVPNRSIKTLTSDYFSDIRENFSNIDSVRKAKSMGGGVDYSMESINESDRYRMERVIAAESFKKMTAPNEYVYQRALRPYFNKQGVNTSKVGPHPDFAALKDSGDIEHHGIVTMFVDIKRSSRLSLLMSLEQAYLVKNRILQACIDVVRALDGYPHRLMGDAIMAFFGDKRTSSEDAIANAVNAASSLKLILTEAVFPELNNILGKDVNLGVRIGLDYGNDEEVIWANYGYGDASEVTALGLPVDLASKAQSQAKTNTAMLGQGILDHIDFPDFYSVIKTVDRAGEVVEEKFILPNMNDGHDKPVNRRCKLLKMECYQSLLPIPESWKSEKTNVKENDNVTYQCFYRKSENEKWQEYKSASLFLEKKMSLKFVVTISNPDLFVSKFPLVAKFVKVNHGLEARNKNNEGKEVKDDIVFNYRNSGTIEHILEEGTSYRGLHTMELTIVPKGNPYDVIYRNIIGVYIK
ncbi:TPA: adenylate/guanylate cyclase domain-containing protein [Vibrio vulnificus]|nr:adenylate/guanylate cyclase domain-containing protein [Vibrio vulnificus]HAS6162355.1 adenylate/guanylate cyclase domain-containing protein [Vibrio vulnificus]HDY7473493.1 adenylate/guanylate cyclase domain-containing protein [Vibrio vulnificus]